MYVYLKNLQGDIIGILDNNKSQIVSYTYDSWGKVISIKDEDGKEITDPNHIGKINPYRYRSYRYDEETGLYYLNSRYYNPEWGRFLNGDNYGGQVGELLTHNIYAYCLNNPINNVDYNGNFALALPWVKGLIDAGLAILGFTAGVAIGENFYHRIKDKTKSKEVEKAEAIPNTKSAPKKTQYWLATKNAEIIPESELTYLEAKSIVESGGNVMCANQYAAFRIANFYPGRILEIDRDENGNPKPGYYWHYHTTANHGKPHIWFKGDPTFEYERIPERK